MDTEIIKTKKITLNEGELDDLVKSELQSRGLIHNRNGTCIAYEVDDDGSIYRVTVTESILVDE